MSLSDQVSDQVGQARNFFDKWLGEHNGNESFPTRLNDAQKESLLWIAVSFIFAAAFWWVDLMTPVEKPVRYADLQEGRAQRLLPGRSVGLGQEWAV